jgi:hypothetical protein
MREKRILRTQCNLGVPGVPPSRSRAGFTAAGRDAAGRIFRIAQRRAGSPEEVVRARGTPKDITVIDDKIAIARENLRELIEQAAAYSGAADDELVAQRITEQEARLQLLTKQRNKLSQKAPNQGERHEEEPHQEEHGGHRGRRCSRRNCRSRDRRQNQTHSGR